MDSIDLLCLRHSSRSAKVTGPMSFDGKVSFNCTRRSGCAKGRGRRSTALTTLKIAVFAPMPRASVQIAARVKPGTLNNVRSAKRRSWKEESNQRRGWLTLLLITERGVCFGVGNASMEHLCVGAGVAQFLGNAA